MSPHSILTLLTTFAIIQLAKAIFYTNKEGNDFPRIGKRRHLYQSEAWSRDSVPSDGLPGETDRQMEPMYNQDEGEIPITSRREHQNPMSSYSKAMYYRALGLNGYRAFSKNKVQASPNNGIRGTRTYY
ncbi:uncharacterized protein LOC110455860 isoform X2 [Mizuhopecten yessoensis]|uniref:Uncharacterized protein n=2 Tax=Mizuhopecten yessoensis TaxID=6573 RepID=A0A210QC67_MIZYE|nr:uncharacterized protein LOC110455860 isoform X2 [Mizuhopecten yessoensis]XP_021361947.1 uncharacterized protein LOC110455860 isoform X2 [Mizuhopecten yessoensis]XP_021361948.1 uncharacterized protein LOC110455860 isoform X2 [Mizuhopecten yessoensis]OWF46346.1 hypothetical protein KP79_PYT04819 [Mizuhopecten yessoensis]